MDQYLTHVFQNFTLKTCSKQFATLIKPQLLSPKPVDLTKLYKPLTSSPLLFNELNLLLSKGVIKYSPANCTIQLSLANVMVYQRMFRMAYFAQQELDSGVAEFVGEWFGQGMENGVGFPVLFDKNKLEKAFVFGPVQEGSIQNFQVQQNKKKGKSKSKTQSQAKQKHHTTQQSQQQYNYHKLIYEYKSRQNYIKTIQKSMKIPDDQQKPLKPTAQQSKPAKPPRKTSKQMVIEQPQTSLQSYMLNVQQLTRLMQLWVCLKILNSKYGPKQKKLSFFDFINHKDRQQLMYIFLTTYSQQVKYHKLQQFIAQLLSPDCLLVFNLIKTRPYITEKQLVKLTLLDVLETRASLNKLIEKGLIYFYQENARTIVYKVVDLQLLETKYVDSIAKGMMNLALTAENVTELAGLTLGHEKVKAKLIQLQCEMQRLDDLLIFFGC